jgi:hypothetical protein
MPCTGVCGGLIVVELGRLIFSLARATAIGLDGRNAANYLKQMHIVATLAAVLFSKNVF